MATLSVDWLCGELTKLLGCDDTDAIGQYILSFESSADIEEYLGELLDQNAPRHKNFIREVIKRYKAQPKKIDLPEDVKILKKQDDDDTIFPGNSNQGKKKKGRKSKGQDTNETGKENEPSPAKAVTPSDSAKKKNKFVPLFSEDGDARTVAKLPGRHKCECLATKHALVNNCISCGRIVCQQEESGPCLFCGELVCTKEEEEVLARGSKKSAALREKLMGNSSLPHRSAAVEKGLQKALEHKNKLLEYDRTSTKRTQVIDDESDYFNADSNKWLSPEQREKLAQREKELRDKRHASRLDRKVTLDFAGRRVVEEEDAVNMYDIQDDVIQEVYFGKGKRESGGGGRGEVNFSEDDFSALVVNPGVSVQPQFVPSDNMKKSFASAAGEGINENEVVKKRGGMRLQDRELQEMVDEGMCMSMHQPWASLLVKGIKKHEGRSWYTPHRGRLWIAATSQQAQDDEVQQMEQFYQLYYKDPQLEFPPAYPSSCLLGCIDVQDCMEQEAYRKKFPDGESTSPYVFVCDNPHELLVKFPMKGKHKIYKLDGKLHQGAKKGLRSVIPPH